MSYFWYSQLTAQVRWNFTLGIVIRVDKGTRQGGLSSRFLVNLFYQKMIPDLDNSVGGKNINDISYDVFCFADDILRFLVFKFLLMLLTIIYHLSD